MHADPPLSYRGRPENRVFMEFASNFYYPVLLFSETPSYAEKRTAKNHASRILNIVDNVGTIFSKFLFLNNTVGLKFI